MMGGSRSSAAKTQVASSAAEVTPAAVGLPVPRAAAAARICQPLRSTTSSTASPLAAAVGTSGLRAAGRELLRNYTAVEMPTGTKADDIALALEEAIVSGEIAPGTVLRQEQLSDRFAVSRTPVREALRRLAALGLVSFVPNRGVRVRTISREELREAFLVRAELESLATELATPRITNDALASLGTAERRFSDLTAELRARARAGSQDARLIGAWVRGNHAFHDVIYEAAGAPLVERIAKSARRSFFTHLVWAAGMDIDHLYEENDLQHRAIREAIAARSAQGARVLAREHVLASGRLLETILDQVQERDRERDRPFGDLRSAS
jgi:DNA-binding GntR family transcriptional regulator